MGSRTKGLLLEMLLAMGDEALPVRGLIEACALFGIPANGVRVTLARLSATEHVVQVGRGAYRLGPAARPLADDVAAWRTAEGRLRPWHGDYATVYVGALGRSDRPALARRERALQLLGFRPFDRGLYLRPDNLEPDFDALRRRLYRLGLDAGARVFLTRGFDAPAESAIHRLWDGDVLSGTYRRLADDLGSWLAGAADLDLATAAKESFLLGSRAIRFVVYDPLLPAPFVDADARRAFFAAVRRFDEAGHAIWRRLFTTRYPETAAQNAAVPGLP